MQGVTGDTPGHGGEHNQQCPRWGAGAPRAVQVVADRGLQEELMGFKEEKGFWVCLWCQTVRSAPSPIHCGKSEEQAVMNGVKLSSMTVKGISEVRGC